VPWRRIDYAYDAQGRRCRKTVTDAAQTVLSDTLYLYDHWNLLAELDAADGNALIRSYVWGLDLSGTPQGAGGVGGLLYVTDHRSAKTWSVAMDGNGNVAGLVDTADGAVAVTYQYDPFGTLLEEITPLETNPVGNRRSGVAARDWANGPGYILFSEQNVHQRFAAQPPASGNAEHFIAVSRQNDQWVYDTNLLYVPFTPHPTDILVAACDFTANTVTLLAGTLGETHGIARGYLSGDLDIIPESFGGQQDAGEFELVAGTAFTTPAPKPANPFRFSTKYTEMESGLVYYGMRYYSPDLGRWLSRDPIEELGGLNLYGFSINNPVSYFDFLGLEWKVVRESQHPWAEARAECDSVKELAEQELLAPEQWLLWLGTHPEGPSPRPASVDDELTGIYRIPNTALLTQGSAKSSVGVNIGGAFKRHAGILKKHYESRGYHVINGVEGHPNGQDISEITKKLQSDRRLYVWAHFGHGDYGAPGNLVIAGTLGDTTHKPSEFRPHHKLREISLFTCQAGVKAAEWVAHLAIGGELYSDATNTNPLRLLIGGPHGTLSRYIRTETGMEPGP
jgi:RHS repeat-associated protein